MNYKNSDRLSQHRCRLFSNGKQAEPAKSLFAGVTWLFGYALTIVAIALTSGCGGGIPTYPVQGQVEFEDGSPVKFGTIEFLNRELKLNARGEINRDGSFTVGTFKVDDGAVAGVHEVTIQQFVTIPLTASQDVQIKHDHGKLVADAYRTYDQSDLTVTVEKSGQNQIKLVVKEKK